MNQVSAKLGSRSAARSMHACTQIAAVLLLATRGSDPSDERASTRGRALVLELLELLTEEGAPVLDGFRADAVQLQRADGAGATRDEYLADPAFVGTLAVGDDLVPVQDGGVLGVRWNVNADETISGKRLGAESAPRLGVFVGGGGVWKSTAHATFNRAE